MTAALIIHSDKVSSLLRSDYSPSDLERLEAFLFARGVLGFRPLATGLFPAADVDAATSESGYRNVWVRDNVFVAHALFVNGRVDEAVRVAQSLAEFFSKTGVRFDDIIAGRVDRDDPMNRVHVRFDGATLSELPERWPHAQNDALGYFVWLYSTLAAAGAIPLTGDGLALLAKFSAYFKAIRFWENEDSGHWEEISKISASSIGVVIGGLEAMKLLLETRGAGFESGRIEADLELVADLASFGRRALDDILPAECAQPEPQKRRRFDAALLFLVYPISVVSDAMADEITADVAAYLQGEIGIVGMSATPTGAPTIGYCSRR